MWPREVTQPTRSSCIPPPAHLARALASSPAGRRDALRERIAAAFAGGLAAKEGPGKSWEDLMKPLKKCHANSQRLAKSYPQNSNRFPKPAALKM